MNIAAVLQTREYAVVWKQQSVRRDYKINADTINTQSKLEHVL